MSVSRLASIIGRLKFRNSSMNYQFLLLTLKLRHTIHYCVLIRIFSNARQQIFIGAHQTVRASSAAFEILCTVHTFLWISNFFQLSANIVLNLGSKDNETIPFIPFTNV